MEVQEFIVPQRMNQDVEDRFLKPDECRRKLNLRSIEMEGSTAPGNENLMGNIESQNYHREAGDIITDWVEDIETDTVVCFVYNPAPEKHKIIRYKPEITGQRAPLTSQPPAPSPGEVELIAKSKYFNFQLNRPISAKIVDGILFWTDGYFKTFENCQFNPPRNLHLARAKKYTDKILANQYAVYDRVGRWWNPALSTYCTCYYVPGTMPFPVGKHIFAFTDDGDIFGIRHYISTGDSIIKSITTSGSTKIVKTSRIWGGGNATEIRDGKILAYDTDQYFGIDWQVLDIIKYKPKQRPSASYIDVPEQKINKLKGELFQFAYRHIYVDKGKSVFSEISAVPIPNHPPNVNGAHDEETPQDNVINVWVDTGPAEVIAVEIVVRLGNTGEWSVLSRIYKYDEYGAVLQSSDMSILYQFTGNDILEPISQSEINKPFDFVPIVAGRLEVIEKNRIIFFDYMEGYDNVKINVNLGTHTEEVSLEDIKQVWTNLLPYHFFWCSMQGSDNTSDNYGGSYFDFNGGAGGVVIEDGYTYICTVEDYPSKYPTDGQQEHGFIPDEYLGKDIRGFAIVYKDPDMTWQHFVDNIIRQLRYPHKSSCVLALNTYPSGTFGLFDGYVSSSFHADFQEPPHTVPSKAVAVLVENLGYGEDIKITDAMKNLKLTITKVSGNLKDRSFKAGANHPFSMWYCDRAGRDGSAYISDKSSIYIPYYNESVPGGELVKNVITWEIYHKPPAWGVYSKWGYGRNTTNEYFLDAALAAIGDSGIGDSLFVDVNSYISNTIDTSFSFNVRPYEWKRGDRIRFAQKRNTTDKNWSFIDTVLEFEIQTAYYPAFGGEPYLMDDKSDYIVDEKGNKIYDTRQLRLVIKWFDYEAYGIKPGDCVVEIYRPKKEQVEKSDGDNDNVFVYFQIDNWMPIIDPYTVQRRHSGPVNNQSGLIPARGEFLEGDVYLVFRSMYSCFHCESAAYSDYYPSDSISIGMVNIVNRDMRNKRYGTNFRWGGKYIQNSNVNDLAKFEAKDFDQLSEKYEDIYAAMEIGYTLKILQKNNPTSITIGRAGLDQADLSGTKVVATSKNVIGAVSPWENGYGTIFPQSVVKSDKHLYFFDIYNGAVIRWADNGMFPISNYGMKKYFRDKSRALILSGVENVSVRAIYEKEFDNLIITFVDRKNPANNETLMFHESDVPEKMGWITFLSFIPDGYMHCGLVLASTLNGRIYRHNMNAKRNTFYGVKYPSEMEIAATPQPDKVIVFEALEIFSFQNWESPNTGDIEVPTTGIPMKSRLKKNKFVTREGIQIAAYDRDMFTHGTERLNDLIDGRPLRGHTIKQRLVNNDDTEVLIMGIKIKGVISE